MELAGNFCEYVAADDISVSAVAENEALVLTSRAQTLPSFRSRINQV